MRSIDIRTTLYTIGRDGGDEEADEYFDKWCTDPNYRIDQWDEFVADNPMPKGLWDRVKQQMIINKLES